MKFPLTEQLLDEARRFELRSACRDCFYWSERRQACWHDWPDEGQRRWPLDAFGKTRWQSFDRYDEWIAQQCSFTLDVATSRCCFAGICKTCTRQRLGRTKSRRSRFSG